MEDDQRNGALNETVTNQFYEKLNNFLDTCSIIEYDKIIDLINKRKNMMQPKVDEANIKIFEYSEAGNTSAVKELIKFITDINLKDTNGDSILHRATKGGCLEMVKYLIKVGADIECLNNDCDSVLHMASKYGKSDIVNYLIDNEMYIDIRNQSRSTPLHVASANGQKGIVKILLKRNANDDIKNFDGQTPFMCVIKEDVAQEFIKSVPNLFETIEKKELILFKSIENNWINLFNKLITENVNVNCVSSGKGLNTPLILAAQLGRTDMLEVLLNNNANVSLKNADQECALHKAADNGHDDCVKLLLKNKANIDEVGFNNRTPLMYAARKGHNTTIILLHKNGANILSVDKNLWNVLHYASYYCHASSAKLQSGGFTTEQSKWINTISAGIRNITSEKF